MFVSFPISQSSVESRKPCSITVYASHHESSYNSAIDTFIVAIFSLPEAIKTAHDNKSHEVHDTHHCDFHYQPVSSGSDGASTMKRRREIWINYHTQIIALSFNDGLVGGRSIWIRNICHVNFSFKGKSLPDVGEITMKRNR